MTPTPLYRADTVISADLDGMEVPVPALKVLKREKTPLVFARPTLQVDEQRYVIGVGLDIKAWLIWDPYASTLPIKCADQKTALACAHAFVDASAAHELAVLDRTQVLAWCSKWIRDHTGMADHASTTEPLKPETDQST